MSASTGTVAAWPETTPGPTTPNARHGPTPTPHRGSVLVDIVPHPVDGSWSTTLAPGTTAGGLEAIRADWRPDGGTLLLSGRTPFAELSGRAGVRPDGTLDGSVSMRATITLAGQALGTASWQVEGWDPSRPLFGPVVARRGTTLDVDLTPLPPGTAVTTTAGQGTGNTGDHATVHLPPGAEDPGAPLSPRLAETYRGLGIDTTALRVHARRAAPGVPAFVTDHELFLAPGIYGVDSPGMLRVLDRAIHAALSGVPGPVDTAPPPPTPDSPAVASVPVADRTVITATIPAALTPQGSPAADTPTSGTAPDATPATGPTDAPVPDTVPDTGSGTGPGASAPGAAADAAGEQAPPPVELIMPEPPTALTPAAAERGAAVAGGARRSGRAARTLPDADADVTQSRGAVTEPPAETAARAQEELAAELGSAPAPSPEIVALCERIRTAIRENRPDDEDELLATDPTKEARNAGDTITGSVRAQSAAVSTSFNALATPPAGTPALHPTTIRDPSTAVPGMGVAAGEAAPDPIPAENTSLEADVAATDQRIATSGIHTRVTQAIPDGPFAETRDARAQLGEASTTTPAQIQATQAQAIATAQTDMAALQVQALAALRASRAGTVHGVGGAQGKMTTHEEDTRAGVGAHAQGLYDAASSQVATLLRPLNTDAIARWDSGLDNLSSAFRASVDETKRWVDERHAGVGGALLSVGDYFTGLPGWVTRDYNAAERAFGDGVCNLLLEISTFVNGVVATVQAIIRQARQDIDDAFTAMAEKFPDWVATERARFSGMLDTLSSQATDAQTGFVTDISDRAIQAVNEVHAEAQALREAAGGLIGRVSAAIAEFIDDPVRAIINGLLRLVGIPPSAFWALVAKIAQVISDIADDPERFINNLVAGLKQGFSQFFDHFGRHVLEGFWNWLFSGLNTPIPMPRDFTATALFSFALELMGITWPRVREILVRHLGPTAVELIEAAWQLVTVLIQRGPDGIVELVKEQLTPESLVDTILDAAIDYLTETLIEQALIRVAGLLNPVGAIAQAIELIYQVCAWVFRNAARIFSFVETVVNGLADVVAGNIGALADAVERALAQLIPPVIDFLAGLCHLGGLPDEIAGVIVRLQGTVYVAMDRVVGFLADRGRALLARAGIGTGTPGEDGATGHDDELGTTVRFRAAGEGHRLWFQAQGATGELMLASTPEPLAHKITTWRAQLPEMPEDGRAEATAALDALAALADDTDALGDQLAREFQEAHHTPADGREPPNDDPLEARERALAAQLRIVFDLFGGRRSEEDYLADISASLPAHGRSYAQTIAAQWLPAITRPRLAPPGTEPIWGEADVQERGALSLLAQDASRRELLPWFLAGSQSQPRSAASGTFRNYAFETDSPDPPHTVRARFLARMGADTATRMSRSALSRVSAEDNSALHAQLRDIGFDADAGRWGAFTNLPGDDVNPLLRTAVTRAGGVVPFLRAMVNPQVYEGVTWQLFQTTWNASPASKNYVKGLFRGVAAGQHEWIPTGYIPEVIQTAIDAAAVQGIVEGFRWVVAQNALRSPTPWVLHLPTVASITDDQGRTVRQVVMTGHTGAFRLQRAGELVSAGTIGTEDFHEWLRREFSGNKAGGPEAYVWHLNDQLPTRVWDGSTSGLPTDLLAEPVGMLYRVGAGVDLSMSIAALAERQRRNWQAITYNFADALTAIEQENGS